MSANNKTAFHAVLNRLSEDLHSSIFLHVEPRCYTHVEVSCEASEVLVEVHHHVVQWRQHDVVHLVE
jgi:hypothetical protein